MDSSDEKIDKNLADWNEINSDKEKVKLSTLYRLSQPNGVRPEPFVHLSLRFIMVRFTNNGGDADGITLKDFVEGTYNEFVL